jgi:hypothetical protein
MTKGEWIHQPMPWFDDRHSFQVWLDNGEVRNVRRAGNDGFIFSPGTLYFTDCVHPLQNMLCHEDRIRAWRIDGRA